MIDDKKTLFSGMQATGNLTLGNYLGALKNWVTLNEEYNCFFCVVDEHSITVRQDPATLRKRARDLLTLYIAAGLLVIVVNIQNLPHAISVILKEAFHPSAIYTGGLISVIIAGLRRSVQTNEAGTGSAPIAYATAQTKEPISLGFVALTEPLFTGFICILTSTIIIITNSYTGFDGVAGIQLTSKAFETIPHASWFPYVLALIVVLFAVTTILSWAYYSQKAWNFLVGEGKRRTLSFQIAFCIFTVIGSVLNAQSVINITDAMMIAMSIPNIIALYILAPEIKRDLFDYCRRFRVGTLIYKDKIGELAPITEEAE